MTNYQIFTLCNLIVFGGTVCLWRLTWFYVNFISYAACVDIYVSKKKIPRTEIPMYMAVWPIRSVVPRFWNWKFKSFVVYPELHDDVMAFISTEFKQNDESSGT